jgi:hypothetical protein
MHASMETTEHQDNWMEIHGQLYEDDDHVDEANAVSWDLFENPVQRDGIFRNFRGAIVVLYPPGRPMWMEVYGEAEREVLGGREAVVWEE